MSLIEIENVDKVFRLGNSRVQALKKISLKIELGERVCLLGPSGSGKSTLLNIMAGFDEPTNGRVIIDGMNINHCSKDTITMMRRNSMGFVFQSYHLLNYLTALENVALPLMLQNVKYKERTEKAKELLCKVGLSNRLSHYPFQMSGGQQQRVGIARAFINNPKIIFADEPTGNLDSRNSRKLLELMTKLSSENQITLIIVSHDEAVVDYCTREIKIVDGSIIALDR